LSEVKYWKKAIPTTIKINGTRPTFRTWKRTTAKTTYSSPRRVVVSRMRSDRPASRP
jgi:hypothetical protein